MLKPRKLRKVGVEVDVVTFSCKRRLGEDMLSNVTSFLNKNGQANLIYRIKTRSQLNYIIF